MITTVKERLAEEKSYVLVRILESKGSTPRHDAWMVVKKDGNIIGTIGGGSLEAKIIEMGQDVFKTKESSQREFKLNEKDLDDLDMRCGGDVWVQFDYIDVNDPAYDDAAWLDAVMPNLTLYVIGGGHVGKAVYDLFLPLGFEIIIIDDREAFSNKNRFPYAKETVVSPTFENIFAGRELGEDSYVVIVSRGHKYDFDALYQGLQTDAKYIGMIGSRSKIGHVMNRLKESGVSEESMKRAYTPIGLSCVPSETPEEIAVSIAAQVLCVKYGKESRI